jgi:hypothetical protein
LSLSVLLSDTAFPLRITSQVCKRSANVFSGPKQREPDLCEGTGRE